MGGGTLALHDELHLVARHAVLGHLAARVVAAPLRQLLAHLLEVHIGDALLLRPRFLQSRQVAGRQALLHFRRQRHLRGGHELVLARLEVHGLGEQRAAHGGGGERRGPGRACGAW